MRAVLIWAALVLACAVPVALVAASPLLQWRDPVYIGAGLAGALALAVMLVQPLLASGALPGVDATRGRRVHRWLGGALAGLVLLHVAGLWITSPPDVVDVLLFRSPTPFSVWGALAMWAVLASAGLAVRRRRLGPRRWRVIHTALFGVIVAGTVVHALLIEGTMESLSKAGLSALVVLATARAVWRLKVWRAMRR